MSSFTQPELTVCFQVTTTPFSNTHYVSYTCITYWCLGNFLLLGEGRFLLISTPSVCCRAYLAQITAQNV